MVIGGLWHGAGWTVVRWGARRGFYLLVNHLWRSLAGRKDRPGSGFIAHAVTLLAVIIAWVLFRSQDLATAARVYEGMLGWNGMLLPEQILALAPALRAVFTGIGNLPGLADTSVMCTVVTFALLALGFAIVLIAPNLHRMPARARLVAISLCFAFTLQKVVFSQDISPFLYFQF